MRYLPDLMKSLREQTFRDFSILVIDNASADGTIEFLREKYPETKVLRNFKNLGFAPAHNQGIKYALAMWRNEPLEECYVLVTNPDIILTPDYLKNIVACAEAKPRTAVFGGKLLKVFRQEEDGFQENVRTDSIDSTGLVISRGRRVVDRGAGELDHNQHDSATEVFGVSGALAFYRASALEAVRCGEEYFDDNFFAYKEDVDLAWRLQLHGFGAEYVPQAKAYHFRRVAGKEKSRPLDLLKNRRQKSKLVNFYSYRNHLWMLVKNEHPRNVFLHFPWISGYELAKFGSILFFEPHLLRAGIAFWRELPKMLEKRRRVMAKSRVSAQEMRKWFQ